MRRLVVALAGIVLSVGVLSFAVGRVVLGVAGSSDAVSGVVAEVTSLPEVHAELAAEISAQLGDDPVVARFADEATIRSVVDTVLDSDGFAAFSDQAATATYRVFFESAPEAEIDVNPLVFDALERLAASTEAAEITALADEFGLRLEADGVLPPGTVGEVTAIATELASDLAATGIDPIVIERTEDDLDFGGIVDSVRLWSTIGLVAAVLAAITILVVSPVALLRRFVPIGIALGVAGLLLLLVSRGTVVLSLDDVERADMIRAIAEALLGRAAAPGYTLLIAGGVLVAAGVLTRVIPERRR